MVFHMCLPSSQLVSTVKYKYSSVSYATHVLIAMKYSSLQAQAMQVDIPFQEIDQGNITASSAINFALEWFGSIIINRMSSCKPSISPMRLTRLGSILQEM